MSVNEKGHLADTEVVQTTGIDVRMAFMFKIVRFPSALQPFFRSLKTEFLWGQYDYFRWFVVLVAFAHGRRTVTGLYRYLGTAGRHHRTRFNNFLDKARCDWSSLLAGKALELLDRLGPVRGEILEFILDDSKKEKRGKHMEAVSWMRDSKANRTMRGHQYVTATIRFQGFQIPWGVELYAIKEDCRRIGIRFRKSTEMAADLIASFRPPAGVKVRVLFDSFYLCPVVVNACRKQGFRFVSTLKANRNLYKNGRKLKAGKYGPNLFRGDARKTLVVPKKQDSVTFTYVDAGWLDVSGLGRLHGVFSRKNAERKTVGLVTDDPLLSAAGVIRAYSARWSIEVFFKDAKQLLGLGQYQNGSYRAAVTHLHLVCFAHALLTHLAIERRGEKGKTKKAAHRSTEGLQNELRRVVWEDLADYLQELPDGNSVVKELGRLLVA